MKRADQHPVTVPSQHLENFDPELVVPDESGVVMPSEKEASELVQTPSMGALPVDNMGSLKTGTEWHSATGDITHTDEANERDTDVSNNKDEPIIATGSGPDPEHIEDI